MNKNLINDISNKLKKNTSPKISEVFGGDINKSYKISYEDIVYFVKINSKQNLNVFEDEFEALEKIQKTNTIKVPIPYICGFFEDESYLIMEYLELSKSSNEVDKLLGRNLANLHKIKYDFFGYFNSSNSNNKSKWNTFFAKDRLSVKIEIAKKKNINPSLVDKIYFLIENINKYLSHNPNPSLIHGDLWGGNFACHNNEPVIYDPSSYYGDREMDLAMSELFGGFSESFYKEYNEVFPISDGYTMRKVIYNLDPVLNHFNLFGGNYERQAEYMIDKILKG